MINLRKADLTTYIRTAVMILIVYLVVIKFNAWVIIVLFALDLASDALDGFFAVSEASKGKISLITYIKSAIGNKKEHKRVVAYKQSVSKIAPYGPRLDIAGDRVTEYALWATFVFLHVLPLFVILIIIVRHSFADAMLASKGTSSKMKSKFTEALFSSNASRFGIQAVKFVTFSYLMLVWILNYPIIIGYILTAILVTYIVIRGISEIYEGFQSYK
ncbi:multipass membrane protein [Candidatus Mancarchaeum acidiphilum]|uniref:Multipass membrane protein n=1 Tax=Candidatus Mancarchaeum acidiphilum TaxID=1920749 RepID=A0A218NP38_9ARCH|nr:multipass membrane protein [Candidatus Mancarchaeum acidiphilum]